jgi:O-antigen/teichoic acid export membrane protein
VRTTVLAIAGFSGAVALGLLAIGPPVMSFVFGQEHDYNRFGLALMGVGMGFHLAAGTLNQALLARRRAGRAAAAWVAAGAAFVVWTLVDVVDDHVLRVEVGYALAGVMLVTLLRQAAR